MPKVSVIIPVYNIEKYLRKCLDSVVNQTLKDIEIICVNDGSTDSSGKILDEYAAKDKRIKVIHKQNEGLSATRNRGINLAEGEFIGFIDSDDWISPDFYLKLYEAATKYSTDIAACNILRLKNGNKIPLVQYKDSKIATSFSPMADLLMVPQYNYVVNKIYKLSLIKNNQIYFPEGIYFEDMRWTPQAILYAQKAVTVPSETYYYNWRDDSTCGMTVPGSRYGDDFLQSKKWIKEFMNKHYCKKRKREYKLFGFIPLLKIEEM